MDLKQLGFLMLLLEISSIGSSFVICMIKIHDIETVLDPYNIILASSFMV